MSATTVRITVSGFSVEGLPDDVTDEELEDVAQDIASDIAMALASLGQWADAGTVKVEVPS